MLAERASLAHPSADPVSQRSEPPVHIGVYDGPLDLLVYLVRREGVALREIPVARICDAYLQHLQNLDEIDVDRAGEYLAMASTLCLLKARELLPKAPRDEESEEEDPRQALERRLVEYERFRDAAQDLGNRQLLDRDVFARPEVAVTASETPIDPNTDTWGLATLFYGLLEQRSAAPPEHKVTFEAYTMAETVRRVLRLLDDGDEHTLSELWADMPFRRARLITFLGVLESARFQLVDVWQRIHLGAISLKALVRADDADLSMLDSHEHDDLKPE
ncbi:segregation and condensation protein A [Deltaproteobacteria bacterium]|nr:segregation and condensation protein A [Deltaproteobacteria bacterium]